MASFDEPVRISQQPGIKTEQLGGLNFTVQLNNDIIKLTNGPSTNSKTTGNIKISITLPDEFNVTYANQNNIKLFDADSVPVDFQLSNETNSSNFVVRPIIESSLSTIIIAFDMVLYPRVSKYYDSWDVKVLAYNDVVGRDKVVCQSGTGRNNNQIKPGVKPLAPYSSSLTSSRANAVVNVSLNIQLSNNLLAGDMADIYIGTDMRVYPATSDFIIGGVVSDYTTEDNSTYTIQLKSGYSKGSNISIVLTHARLRQFDYSFNANGIYVYYGLNVFQRRWGLHCSVIHKTCHKFPCGCS